MKGRHSGRRRSIEMVGLLFILAGLGASAAQDTRQPTLGDILERLEANLDRYDADVPSLFSDEHVVSQVVPGERDQNTVTDSVFRLKRTPNPDHTTTLVESREIKIVDGKPATSQKIDGPTLLSGVFEGGLAVVSPNQTSCMNYTLQRINKSRAADPYIVHFATVLTPENIAGCLLQEGSKGRVFIDPASMQIAHLELTTPRHVIFRGDAYRSRMAGERVLTVDYAPVLLGGETFWMPSTITSRTTSDPGTFHPIVWSFRATYRNYHKLEVTSRIVPANGMAEP
jgi:hypothetical protein